MVPEDPTPGPEQPEPIEPVEPVEPAKPKKKRRRRRKRKRKMTDEEKRKRIQDLKDRGFFGRSTCRSSNAPHW